jgi:hypothetical protein
VQISVNFVCKYGSAVISVAVKVRNDLGSKTKKMDYFILKRIGKWIV